MIHQILGAIWYALFFPLMFISHVHAREAHDREWDKKMCICGHLYRKHEDRPDRKRPINACNIEECDCRDFTETRMEKEKN